MVIQAPTVLTSGGSGADALEYNTALINPDAGSLIAVFVEAGAVVAGENGIPTITDTIGLDWTLADTEINFGPALTLRGNWFTAWADTNDTGTISFTYANMQSSCHWHVLQIVGARDTIPVLQTISTAFNTTLNPSVNLPTAPAADSLVLAAVMRNGTTPFTAGPNHTVISSVAGNSGPTVGSDVSYDLAPASQAVQFMTSSGVQKTIFALEIAIGGEVAPPPTPAEATLIRKWKQSEITSDNVFELTVPHDLEVGETLVISVNRVTGASPQPITGVTGIGANVATLAATATRASTLIAGTIVIPITEQILNGTVISINITSGSPSRKVAVCSVWSGLTGAVDADSGTVFGSGPNGSSALPSASTTASATSVPALIIGTFGHGTAAFTPDPGNTLVDTIATAVGTTDRGVSQTSRVDTGAGVKTASGSLATSGGWAANVIALPLASAAPGAPTADAGGNIVDVEPGDEIDLSASGSTASGAMTFVWTQTGGEPVDFTSTGADLHIDEAPWTIAGTTLEFTVSVTSGGITSTDTVTVAVLPSEGRIMVNGVEVPLKTIQVG